MSAVVRYHGGFRWEGVALEEYRHEAEAFGQVTRQRLCGAEIGLAGELRYFELTPGGHTSLERHAHAHAVMVLRGRGRVFVGETIHAIEPFDLVRIVAHTWHQFRADASTSLGFLCLVDAERDRPQRPSPAELQSLRADPEVAAFVRL